MLGKPPAGRLCPSDHGRDEASMDRSRRFPDGGRDRPGIAKCLDTEHPARRRAEGVDGWAGPKVPASF